MPDVPSAPPAEAVRHPESLCDGSSFADALLALYETRFTGPVTLHLVDGVVKVLEFAGPQVRLSLPTRPLRHPDHA